MRGVSLDTIWYSTIGTLQITKINYSRSNRVEDRDKLADSRRQSVLLGPFRFETGGIARIQDKIMILLSIHIGEQQESIQNSGTLFAPLAVLLGRH